MAMTFDSPEHAMTPNHVSSSANITMMTMVGNVTSEEDNMTYVFMADTATGASIASPIVMFLTGLVGNILALVVLHKTKTEIRSMMFYTLVAALTWNDLIGICITSPPVLSSYLNQRHMPDKLCRFHAFAMVCFGLSTPLIMCTMAVERSLALKCTYFYSKHCNPSTARIVVGVLWVFVLIFSMLPLFGLGAFKLQYPKTWCFLDFRPTLPLDMAYADTYAIINLLVVAAMFVCNGLVVSTLFQVRKTRRMSNASVNSTLLNADAVEEKASRAPQQMRKRHQRDVELHMICLLCAITTIFSVCWVPLMVYILISVQSPETHSPVFGLVAIRLASLNQTLNPWIYVILRKTLLSRIRRLCQDCVPCGEDYDPPVAPAQPRKLTQYNQPAMGAGRPNNYVHVRNQLCPSSQYVGQGADSASVSEGRHKGSKGRGSSSRSAASRRYCTETDDEWRRAGGGSSSGGMCSICRARILMEADSQIRSSVGSLTSSYQEGPPCSLVSASARDSADHDASADYPSHSVFDPSLLRNGAESVQRASDNSDSLRSESSNQENPITNRENPNINEASRRLQVGRMASESLALVNSYVSEADDCGYVSRVSTDSSRMSTPERPQHRAPSDGAVFSDSRGHKDFLGPVPVRLRGVISSALKAKQRPLEEFDSPDTSLGFGSGVFSSRDYEYSGNSIDGRTDPPAEPETSGRGGERQTASRTISNSSAGTHTESSSGHDRCSVIHRQLSTSSGH